MWLAPALSLVQVGCERIHRIRNGGEVPDDAPPSEIQTISNPSGSRDPLTRVLDQCSSEMSWRLLWSSVPWTLVADVSSPS